ncbi:MAG: hypothetical protein IJ274_13200 [Lachnospiraceae bacterium]|nr:hypothetical protein [Lachnospiraceae bacterium]
MTTLNIVKNNLQFLIDKYGFTFEFNDIRGEHYIFKNKNGYIEFYEWEQFDESAIFVKYDMIAKKINLIEEYPKMIGEFSQRHKGFKWFFKDKRYDYWEMISKIIQIEINNKSIFGLKL